MISKLARGLTIAAFVATASGAVAQETTNRVAANVDWSSFVWPPICGEEGATTGCRQATENPDECWAVSKPKETVNTKNGSVVQVNRGDILLFVSYRPGSSGQVSFTGGYPFAGESTVALTIGGTTYQLFVDGEWAWARPEDDAKIIAAMKAGADAVLVGMSSRGTRTEDKFSLLGFTAAVDDAAARCK